VIAENCFKNGNKFFGYPSDKNFCKIFRVTNLFNLQDYCPNDKIHTAEVSCCKLAPVLYCKKSMQATIIICSKNFCHIPAGSQNLTSYVGAQLSLFDNNASSTSTPYLEEKF
jgi:hypothetical protein